MNYNNNNKMPPKKRKVTEITKNDTSKKITKEMEIYDKYISDSKINNLVIEKVKEKLLSDILPEDVDHFNKVLMHRYRTSIILLHETSEKISKVWKKTEK